MQKKYAPCSLRLILVQVLHPPAFYDLTTGGEHLSKSPGKYVSSRKI